jgi:hypothetical protein
VPTGGNVTPSLLLGWGPAVCLGAALACVAWAFAVALGEDDADDAEDEAEADPVLGEEEAVLWVTVPEAAPVVEVELDDPPHAVSSSTSEPSPVATVHPLLRITCLSLQNPVPGSFGWARTQPVDVTSLAVSLITCHLPSRPLPLVLSGAAPLNVYKGKPS